MLLLNNQPPIEFGGTCSSALLDNIDGSFLAHLIETLSLQALQEEPAVWPHFGLVSPFDNGSHDDMNYATLTSSAAAIAPYLSQCFTLGYQQALLSDKASSGELFLLLRDVGIQAETVMLRATKQVNTHKGAIFLLAILLGALGHLMAKQPNRKPSIQSWLKQANALAQPFIAEDLCRVPIGVSQTYGEWAYVRYGIEGVRGVVNQGYQLIRQAFHFVQRYPRNKQEIACSQMRLFFVAHSEDTNILKRGGFDQYQMVRKAARGALHKGGVYTQQGRTEIMRLEQHMQQGGLSAAAAGDMTILLILAVKLYEKNLIAR